MATASSAAKACFNTDFVRWVQGLKGDKREMLRRIVSGGVLEGTSAKNCLRRLQLQTYVKLIRCDDRQTEPHFPADVPVPEVPEVPALSPASDNSQRPCPLSRKRPSVTREEVTPKRRKSVDVVLVKYVTKKPVEVINIVSPDCDSPLTPTDTNDLEGDAIEDNPPSELKPASPTSERTVPRCISPVKPSVISQSIDATASSAASSGATEAIPQSSSLPSPSKEADGNADQKRSPSSKVPQRESFHAEENTLGSSQTTPTPSGPSPAGLQEVLKGMASEIYEAEIEFVRLDNRVKSFENDEGKKNSRTYQALLDSNAVLTMKAASIKSFIDRDIVKRFGKQFYPDLLAEVQKIPRLHLYSTMRLMTVLNVLLQLAEPVSSVTKPIQSSTASNSPPSEVTSPSITCPASNQSCQPVPACETAVVQTTFQHTPVTSRQAVQPIVATNNRNDLSLVQLLSTSARTSEALQPRPQQTSAISQPKCVLPQQVQSHLPSTSNQCRPHANARVPLLEQTARKQRILPAPQHQPSNQQHPHVERRQQSHQNNQQYQKPAQVRQMQQLYAASNSNMQQPPGIHQGQYSNRTVASTNLHVTGTHSLQGADKNSSRPNHNIVHRVASSSASTYSAKPNVPSISSVSSSVGVSSIARSSALPVRAPTVSSLQVPTYNQQSIRLTQIVAQSQKSSSVVPQTSTPNQVLQAQTQNTGNVYHRRDVPQTSNISKLQQAMQAPRQQQSTQQPQHINQRPQLLQQPQQNLQQPQQIFQQPQQIFQQPQQIFQQPQQMYVQSQRTVQQPTQVFQQPQQIVQLPRQIVQQPQQIVQQQAQIVQQPHRIVQQSQQIVQQQPQIVQHSHQMVQQPQQIVQQQHQVFQQTHQVVNLPQQAVQQPHQVARQPQQIAQQPYQQYNGALGVYAVSGVQVQTVPYVQQTLPSTLPVTATYQQHVAHIPSVQESGTNFQVVAQMSPVIRACSRDSGISTPEPAVRDFIEEQINGSQQQRR